MTEGKVEVPNEFKDSIVAKWLGVSIFEIPDIPIPEYNLAWACYLSEKQIDTVNLAHIISASRMPGL